MPQSETDIGNLALRFLGQAKTIGAFTERSTEAGLCQAWYYNARDEVLREWEWEFARAYQQLEFLTNNPTSEWLYSYRYPSNVLFLRRLVGGKRSESETLVDQVKYEIATDASGRVIYTNYNQSNGWWQNLTQSVPTVAPTIWAEYTLRGENIDVGAFTPEFCTALAAKLAYYIAPALTSGDPKGLGKAAWNAYLVAMSRAAGADKSEQRPELPPESEFIRARD